MRFGQFLVYIRLKRIEKKVDMILRILLEDDGDAEAINALRRRLKSARSKLAATVQSTPNRR